MSKINKILVIGAGIAGPAVCYWLKRFGFPPTLIEKFGDLRKGGQALDIRGVAIDLVKKMGIYEQICKMRTGVQIGYHVDIQGNVLHEEKGERFGYRQGEEVEILRGDLIEILMNLIKDVPCYFNQSVDSIQQNDHGVKVQFKDGRKEDYDLIIGADGIHSTTRRMFFDKNEYQLVNLGSYLSIFTIPNYLNLNHAQLMCESNQKMASITSDKDRQMAQASFLFRSEHVLNNIRDESEQQEFLSKTFQDFGWETKKILELMPKSHDFYFDSITQVKMKSWSKGRITLLGDAASCASPLSGQGNNLALVGGYILAGELKKSIQDYALAFDRYHQLLSPFVEINQKFGLSVSQSYLVDDAVSKEIAEQRTDKILKEMKIATNGISLPSYE